MTITARSFRLALAPLAALGLSACAGTYTGPVEVTRFVAEDASELGKGSIAVAINTGEDQNSEFRGEIYQQAILDELERLGYTASLEGQPGQQVFATVTTRRVENERSNSRTGVSVGGNTGTFGTGVGLGLGLLLGGGGKAREATSMELRITSQETGLALWEGRAQIITSIDSKYNSAAENARALAAALFKDFPGGNGETVSLSVDDLERTP